MQRFLYGEELVFSAKKDSNCEFVFPLPEYLPNISRIVTTSASVEKCSLREGTPEAAIDVSLSICVIYVSDFGGRIKNAVFRESVSVNLPGSIPENEDITPMLSAFVSSVSSKPETSRRIHTVCSISVSAAMFDPSHCEMFDNEANEGVCLLTNEADICTKASIWNLPFEHEAEITIDKENHSVGEIIFADAVFCSSSANSRDSQLDFEGNFMLHVLYEASSETGDEGSSYAVINAPVTVRDVIRDDRIKENMPCFIHLDVACLEPSVSFDPYGENRVVSFTLKYSADACFYSQSKREIVSDAFSEAFESRPLFSDIPVRRIIQKVSDTVQLSQSVRGDIKELSDISDCRSKIMSVSMEHNEGKIFAAVRCALGILGTNMSGELCAVDNTVTLHVPVYTCDKDDCDIIPDVLICIKKCTSHIKEGELIADFDIGVSGVILSRTPIRVVTNLDIDESAPTNSKKGEVIIFYPRNSDNLWNISKKFHVNPETVKQVNSLENDNISSKHILLIP